MRLIDADALMVKNHENVAVAHNERAAQLLENIMNAPTIEARPAVRGEWIAEMFPNIWDDDYVDICYKCSECGAGSTGVSPFCPNCGADMRGEEVDRD